MKQTDTEKDYTSTYTSFTVAKPKWDVTGLHKYQKQTSEKLKDLLLRFKKPEFIPVLCELFSKMLVISAEQNFETINSKSKLTKKKQKQNIYI